MHLAPLDMLFDHTFQPTRRSQTTKELKSYNINCPFLISKKISSTWLMQLQLQEIKQGFVPFKERAQAWLHALPTSYGFTLNPCEFRLACCLRLDLPITISKWVESCNCNASLDNSGYHLLTCKTGGGPIWSHESIAGVWLECLRNLRIHHCHEPRNRYTNSECRPNIIMFDAESDANIDLDISLAHPWSSDVFPSSAETTGVAANQRETRKMANYEQHKLPGGSVVKVVPLVMEHFGS